MGNLFLALILGLIPIVGLFAFGSLGLRTCCALLVTGEAFACGWGLSMFISAMSAWNRYGEPNPPYGLAVAFAVVTALITLPIAMYRPKRTRGQQPSEDVNPTRI